MNSKGTPTRRGKEIASVYSEEGMYEYTPTPLLNLPGLKEVRCLAPNDGKAYWLADREFEKRYIPNRKRSTLKWRLCGKIFYPTKKWNYPGQKPA